MNQELLLKGFNLLCEKLTGYFTQQNNSLIDSMLWNTKLIKQSLNDQTNYLRSISENTHKYTQQLIQLKNNPKLFIDEQVKSKTNRSQSKGILKSSENICKIQNSSTLIQSQYQIINKIKEIISQNKDKKKPLVNLQDREINQLKISRKKQQFINPETIAQRESNFVKIKSHKKNNLSESLNNKQMIEKDEIKKHKRQISKVSHQLKTKKQSQLTYVKITENQQKNKYDKSTPMCELILTNDPKINYKQKFILVPLSITFDQKNEPKFQQWMVRLYSTLNQKAFFGFSKQFMSYSETKAFYSKNLMYNFINFIKSMKQINKQCELAKIFEEFQKKSRKILKYQKLKYTQTVPNIFISDATNNLIEQYSKYQDPENDIVKNSGVKFIWNHKKNYNRQIKQFLNVLTKKVKLEYRNFQTTLTSIFTKRFQNSEISYSKSREEGNNKYLDHKINKKFPSNFPIFQEKSESLLQIPNIEILHIIIKWIGHLKQKLNKPEEYILDRIYPFTGKEELEINLDPLTKKQICEKFKSFLQKKKYINEMKYLTGLENSILDYIEQNIKSLPFIKEQEVEIGLAAHLLSEQVIILAINQLNQLIHTILQFQQLYKPPKKTTDDRNNNYIQEKKKSFYDVSYITFNEFKLMSAQCTGTIEELTEVYQKVKQTKECKIIRVKDRLQTYNRDILINLKYKDLLICQLSLKLKLQDKEQKKLAYTSQFNHFLHGLENSIYGTLRQSSNIMIGQLQHYNKFKELLKAERKNLKYQKITQNLKARQSYQLIIERLEDIEEAQINKQDIEQLNTIYICKNCYQISYQAKFKICQNEICCQCVLQKLNTKKRRLIILGEAFKGTEVEQISQNNFYILVSKNNIKNRRWVMGENQFYIDIEQNYDNILNKKYQNISISKFTQNEEFIIFKSQATFECIYQGFKTKLSLKYELYQILQNQIEKFRQRILKELIQKQRKKQKMEKWIQKQIHEVNFENCKFQQKEYEKYVQKFDSIVNLNLSNNSLKNIEFINPGKMTKQNLLKLQKLNISNNPCINIRILQKFKDIKRLQLSKIQMNDFEYPDLTKLEYLDISENNLFDLKINTLVNLKYLNIRGNHLKSLDIRNNKKLEYLNASNQKDYHIRFLDIEVDDYDSNINKIHYIGIVLKQDFTKKLAYGVNLKQVILQEVKICEHQFIIQNHTQLKKIELRDCQIQNCLVVQDNNKLEFIHIIYNKPISDNKKKKELEIGVKQFETLKSLKLHQIIVKQFKIEKCRQLEQIQLIRTKINDGLIIIPQLPKLNSLRLNQLILKQLKLYKCPRIRSLSLEQIQIINNDIIIPELPNLNKLVLANVIVQEFSLQNYPKLQQLQINKIKVNDRVLQQQLLISLPQLPNLQKLKLIQVRVQKLMLQKYSHLQQIWLQGIQTENEILIPQLPYLKKLRINQFISKQLKIIRCPELQEIQLSVVKIIDRVFTISQLKHLKKLTLGNLIFQELRVNDCPEFQQIQLYRGKIIDEVLRIPELPTLKIFKLKKVTLKELKLQNYSELQQIYVEGMYIPDQAIVISGLNILKILKLNQVSSEQLIIQKCPELRQIQLSTVKVIDGVISITELVRLNKLKLNQVIVKQLKIQNCPDIEQIQIKRVKITNGILHLPQLPYLKKIVLHQMKLKQLQILSYQELQQIILEDIEITDQILQIPELPSLQKLRFNKVALVELKIQSCPELQNIQFYSLTIRHKILSIPEFNRLRILYISQITLKSLILQKYPLLQTLLLQQMQLTDEPLIMFQMPSLLKLIIRQVTLKQLQLSKCSKLEQVQFEGMYITDKILIIPQLISLHKLNLNQVILKELIVQKCQNLQQIQISKMKIQNGLLVFPELPFLIKMCIQYVVMKQLILSNFPGLQSLTISNVQITNCLVVKNLPKLKTFYFNSNKFKKIKVEFTTILENLKLGYNNAGKCKLDHIPIQQISKPDFKYEQDNSIKQKSSIKTTSSKMKEA